MSQVRQSLRSTVLFLAMPLGAILCGSHPARGAEPFPPLMKTLLETFPEQNGWFVEGPLGTVPGIPEEARPFFECPRVLVPGFHQIDLAAGKVLAAGLKLPVKKITHYDRKPGEVGLPGFRGVWCVTDDKSDVGFLLLTPNENRYLIWARHCFYPAFAVDSIQGKIRDWYARSVADHLASIDYGVPAAVPPLASEHNLPPWMDLYPDTSSNIDGQPSGVDSVLAAAAEIRIWGCSGFTEFVPTAATIDRLVSAAPETLLENQQVSRLQDEYRDLFEASGGNPSAVNALTTKGFDTLPPGWYLYAVDKYGRVRIAASGKPEGTSAAAKEAPKRIPLSSHSLLFPDEPLLAAGRFDVTSRNGRRAVETVTAWSDQFYPTPLAAPAPGDTTGVTDESLLTLGHFFAILKDLSVPIDGVRIRKF